MTPGPGIEPGAHWWEASALTTVPTLLPTKMINVTVDCFIPLFLTGVKFRLNLTELPVDNITYKRDDLRYLNIVVHLPGQSSSKPKSCPRGVLQEVI